MTVSELIAELKRFPRDLPVVFKDSEWLHVPVDHVEVVRDVELWRGSGTHEPKPKIAKAVELWS